MATNKATQLDAFFRHRMINGQSTSPTSSTSSSELYEAASSLARTKPYLKQAIFNKPFNLLMPGGCCPCSECCLCPIDPLPGDYPDPGVIDPDNPPLGGLFNRFGSSGSSSSRRVVRRRYVRPNGVVVVEIEEQPSGFRGSGLFGGGGLFSRFIPSALENGNVSRRQQVNPNPIIGLTVNPSVAIRERKDRYDLNRRQMIRVNQG
uniref:Uncharacterized protein n=1 Tax=Tetranychus urticae TaxID=32264 RepID=T1KY26_TETUR